MWDDEKHGDAMTLKRKIKIIENDKHGDAMP